VTEGPVQKATFWTINPDAPLSPEVVLRSSGTDRKCPPARLLLPPGLRNLDFRSRTGRVGSGVLVAEQQFRKVIGLRQTPTLLSSIAKAISNKPIAKGVAVA
jgi:hypothetical protein